MNFDKFKVKLLFFQDKLQYKAKIIDRVGHFPKYVEEAISTIY